MNDTFYQFSQALVNRTTSTYNNILTINATIEDVVGEYSCTATNSLGSSNKLTKAVKGKVVSVMLKKLHGWDESYIARHP